MAEPELLIMKMVQEGKITPEQAVTLLEAIRADVPRADSSGPEAPASGAWSSVSQMQRKLAELQQRLAEMQAKLGAAQAGGAAAGSAHFKLPFGMGEFNLKDVLEETVRGVSVISRDAVVTARRAARQAQKEARKIRQEAEKMGHNVHVEFRVQTSPRPAESANAPESSASAEALFDEPTPPRVSVDNPFGDVTVSGVSADGRIHAKLAKRAWASSDAERMSALDSLELTSAQAADGALELSVALDESVRHVAVACDVELTVPPQTTVAAKTTFGRIQIESIDGGVARVETETGAIRLLRVHAPDTAPPTEAMNRTGETVVSQWRGSTLSITSLSGGVQVDTADAARVQVETTSGDTVIRSARVTGNLSVCSSSGDVELTGCQVSGQSTIRSQSGDVALRGDESAGLAVETASGDVSADRDLRASGRLALKTISGDIELGGAFAAELNATTASGDIDIRMATDFAGPLSVATVSGDTNVTVPPGCAARVTVTTHSGKLHCAAPLSETAGDGDKFITGRLGAAGGAEPSLMLQSVSGDIELAVAE